MDNIFFDKFIGEKYRENLEDGSYFGCMQPIYLLYPESPRFEFNSETNNYKYIIGNFCKYCQKIDIRNIEFGDIIIYKAFSVFHFVVYVGNSRVVHTQKSSSLQYSQFKLDDKRILGIFRPKG